MTGVYTQLAECECALDLAVAERDRCRRVLSPWNRHRLGLAEARLVEARLAFAKARDAVSDAERAACGGGGGRLPLS